MLFKYRLNMEATQNDSSPIGVLTDISGYKRTKWNKPQSLLFNILQRFLNELRAYPLPFQCRRHFGMGQKGLHWVENAEVPLVKLSKVDVFVNPKTAVAKEGKAVIDFQAQWEPVQDVAPELLQCYRVYV